MTFVVWTAIGMSVSTGLLHAVLGLRRPWHATSLAFAVVMALQAAWYFCGLQIYEATSLAAAAPWARRLTAVVALGMAAFGWFLAAYARIAIPRPLIALHVAGVVAMAASAVVTPMGAGVGAAPRLTGVAMLDDGVVHIIESDLGVVQVAFFGFVALTFAAGVVLGIQLYRRGERRRGLFLSAVTAPVVIGVGLDLVRDLMGGTWLDLSELGAVSLSLVMSIQLGLDFRADDRKLAATLAGVAQRTAELSAMVEAALEVRDRLNTPLQNLELGLAMRAEDAPAERATLAPMQAAVVELAELGRAVERSLAGGRVALAHPEADR